MDLTTTAHLFSSLVEYLYFARNRFDHYEGLGISLTENETYVERRNTKRKLQLGEKKQM